MRWNQVTWYSKLLALVLLVALPFSGFYAGIWYQKQISPAAISSVPNTAQTNGSKTVADSDQITVKTTYKNGVLRYSGSVSLPTPCYELSDNTTVAESFPEQVQIRIEIQNPKEGTLCTQVITERKFSGQVKVSEKATVLVYLDGELVQP